MDPPFIGVFNSATLANRCSMPLIVTMRATPTYGIGSGTTRLYDGSATGAATGVAASYLSNQRAQFDFNASGGGFTTGRPAICWADVTNNAVWQFTAEL